VGVNGMALQDKSCIPCAGGTPKLTAEQIGPLGQQLATDWEVVEEHHLQRTWSFADFATALEFVNAAGAICEEEFHHADFDFGWGRVGVTIWTHKIDGLTESDFVLAAKLDQI
jgi:4a-hydroxytetrahydrobiopterin dehydratase